MGNSISDGSATLLTIDLDRKNLRLIDEAVESGRINDEAAEYLRNLYSDSMNQFREVFFILGKCFGAPKAAVMKYDYDTDSAVDEPIRISDICPLSPYVVSHRLDADPMRNQFFTSGAGHKIDLSVSSIVTVLVAAQKKIGRALDKITGKYYRDYTNEVADTVVRVLTAHGREASGHAIAEKIRAEFEKRYTTTASETALAIIGRGYETIAVDLVRALDKIEKPYHRLQDVWRVKCLFDLVPQARVFIERLKEMMPERVISSRDKFYDMENPRNYRDAKVILNLSDKGFIPMEIICQVRTFFEFERKTHGGYEAARKAKNAKSDDIEAKLAQYLEQGIKEYNHLVCNCLEDLFERIGWNILYNRDGTVSMFEGFPKECRIYYPQTILDNINEKLNDMITNEMFRVVNTPAKLSKHQESQIFHFMARFVLVAAMPYMQRDWAVKSDTMAGKLFNFVMNEVQRYYKKKK